MDKKYYLVFFTFVLCFFWAPQTHASVSSGFDYKKISQHLISEAQSALSAGKPQKAVKLYQQAIVANPLNITAFVGLGQIYTDLGQYSVALKYFNIALNIDPVDILALSGRTLSALKSNKNAEAKESFATLKQVCKFTVCAQLNSLQQAIQDLEMEKSAK